jgi:hypothetical protein
MVRAEQTRTHVSPTFTTSSDASVLLHGSRLSLARIAWAGIVVPAYVVLLANLPAYFASLHHLHAPGKPPFTVLPTPADAHTLRAWGVSIGVYAVGVVLVTLLFQLSYAAVGLLLFWRKARDRAALVTSFALMMLPFGFANITLQALPPGWSWLIPTLSALGNGSLMFCAFVFPDGRFVPSWTRWLAVGLLGYWVIVAALPSWQLERSWPSLSLFFGLAVAAMAIQLYRYRSWSTPRQRQQTKWAVFGVATAVAGNIAPRLLYFFALLPRSGGSSLAYTLQISLIMGMMLAIPLTLGMAILSARLWDVDLLINRTLVYGVLTALLAGVYLGTVIGLQVIVQNVTGHAQPQPPFIVVSTLLIAALFEPLRRRLQAIIDRRFYRRKYDAARALAAFGATLHSEVDLARMSVRLLEVVDETMQPAHVSLWLRSFGRDHEGPGAAGNDTL